MLSDTLSFLHWAENLEPPCFQRRAQGLQNLSQEHL